MLITQKHKEGVQLDQEPIQKKIQKLGMHNIFRTHKFVIMGDFVLSADNETISW